MEKKIQLRFVIAMALLALVGAPARAGAAPSAATAEIVLTRVQQILGGENIDDVLASITASKEAFPEAYKKALWDFYKARRGVEWDKTGKQVPALGKRRRFWIEAGHQRVRDLLGVQLVQDGKEKTTLQKDIEADLEALWNLSMQDEGMKGRAVLAADAALNVIYVYIDAKQGDVNVDLRARNMKAKLRLLHVEHRRALYPVFIVKWQPGGRKHSGGTFKPDEIATTWSSAEQQKNTSVPWADLGKLLDLGTDGIVSLTLESVTKAGDDGGLKGWAFTLLHEAGHSIDAQLGIVVKGDTVDDIPGQKYDPPSVGEYAAEAYSRYYLVRSKVCRPKNLPAGMTQATCNKKVIDYFNAAPAFKDLGIVLE